MDTNSRITGRNGKLNPNASPYFLSPYATYTHSDGTSEPSEPGFPGRYRHIIETRNALLDALAGDREYRMSRPGVVGGEGELGQLGGSLERMSRRTSPGFAQRDPRLARLAGLTAQPGLMGAQRQLAMYEPQRQAAMLGPLMKAYQLGGQITGSYGQTEGAYRTLLADQAERKRSIWGAIPLLGPLIGAAATTDADSTPTYLR